MISLGAQIIPIEVKAGKTGSLKSLHAFLRARNLVFGLRFNSDMPSLLESEIVNSGAEKRGFHLLSLPLYLANQHRRLCRAALERI